MSMKPITVFSQPARQRKWVRERKRERNLRFQLLLLDLLTKSCRFDRLEKERVIRSCWLEGCRVKRKRKNEREERGQEERWMDVNIKAKLHTSILQACRQKPQRWKACRWEKAEGWCDGTEDERQSEQQPGPHHQQIMQSAGSQERRGWTHTHTHTHNSTAQRLSLIHFTSLVQRCLSRGNSVRAYIPIPGLTRLADGKQAACRCQKPGLRPAERARLRRSECINAPRYWLSTLASLLSPHPLLLFHSPYLSYISFSPSLAISLALFLSPRTHTCTLFLSLSQSWADWDACKNWKEEGENVEAWHPWSLFPLYKSMLKKVVERGENREYHPLICSRSCDHLSQRPTSPQYQP